MIAAMRVDPMRFYWPGLAIGLIVGFYWGRVLRLVFKTRRDVGHAANFLPPELLGRLLRIVWYPTVAAWIVIPFLTCFPHRRPIWLQPIWLQPIWLRSNWLRTFWLRPPLAGSIIAWMAVAVALLALAATMVCWRKMGRSWRMGIDPGEKTALIVTGPYGYVRHPIYALQCVLAVASGVAVPSPAMGAIVVLELIFLQWEARREEKYLSRLHGSEYQLYLSRVGRFAPRSLARYVPNM